jgi:hypothetical protein
MITFAISPVQVVLDVMRVRALREEDPFRKLVALRSLHLHACDGCDSGDELELQIAKLSDGAAERVRVKRYGFGGFSRFLVRNTRNVFSS